MADDDNNNNDMNHNNFPGLDSNSNASQVPTNSIESLLYHATAEELDPLFEKIRLPHRAREKCKQIFQDVFTHGIFCSDPKIPNQDIFASILYIAVIETSTMNGYTTRSFTTLTDILLASNININQMFVALHAILEKLKFSETFGMHFHDLRERYLVISLLFHTFERKCAEVFKVETCENGENEVVASPIRKTEGVDCRKKLCWLLFLLTKHHLLPCSSELYLHFQLLLCCLEYVLSKTPMFLLNSPYASIRFRHDSPCAGESMLEKLAKDFNVNFDETQALHYRSTEPFFKDLSDSDGDDVDLLFQCDKLCDMYKDISSEVGALNELLFLSYHPLVMPLQVAEVSVASTDPIPLTSGQGHMTPIRGTMNAVHQLEQMLQDLVEEPGEKLESFFQTCSPSPAENIANLIGELKDKFLEASQSHHKPGSSQYAMGQQRNDQGTKLFYKVLECLLTKNSDRPMESLFNNDVFIRSAFAFSMEIILATYGQRWDEKTKTLTFGDSSFPFPWILKVTSLQAYRFDLTLDSFMSAVDNLCPDIVRYLQNICKQIQEKLAWEEGSPLFDALSQSETDQMAPFSSPVKGSNHTYSGVDLFLSPTPSSMPASDGPTGSTQDRGSLPPPSLPKRRSQSLITFLNKVNKLGFHRLSNLCTSLLLPDTIKDRIWTCVDYCVRVDFVLLKNRHIDQVIICCVHSICKTSNFSTVSLETIVDKYKAAPFANSEVYDHVFISHDKTSSIAKFYRDVFEKSKTHDKILQLSAMPNPLLSPHPKVSWSSPRPCGHLGKSNLIISPMRNNSMRSPGKFYSSIGNAINPQSPNTFKMINKNMTDKGQSLQRTVKRLDFDEPSHQSSDFKQRKLDSCKLPMT